MKVLFRMKRNEIYNPHVTSSQCSQNLSFRLAVKSDCEAIIKLMAERNPNTLADEIRIKTDREIDLNTTDPTYRLYVADISGRVVGLCRFFHSHGLPKEKIIYSAPAGWYGMGLLVDSAYRRQSIASFLFQNRLQCLREYGADICYSMVDGENLASIKMHETFGYVEQQRAEGFLHVKFESGFGILYQKTISA